MRQSRSVLTWCFRAMWRDDPALRRIERLKGYGAEASKATIPVFLIQKVTLA